MKPDDSSLTPDQYAVVRKHARRVLEGAGGFGRWPTPVAEVMEHARIHVADEDVFSETFVDRLRRTVGTKIKAALSKVRGMLDVRSRIAYIDKSLLVVRQTFLKLHEAAHALLPHQKGLYSLVEDCERTIAPEVSELFDREANVFASEVLFQLDTFSEEACSKPFGLSVPLRLAKKYGASAYASIRQYVSKNPRACAVLVIDPPTPVDGLGFEAHLRRVASSPSFDRLVGAIAWPSVFSPNDRIGAIIPLGGRRMSRPQSFPLVNVDGIRFECLVEAFATPHQVFVLVHSVETLNRTVVLHGAT